MVKNLLLFVFNLNTKTALDVEIFHAIAKEARATGDPFLATLTRILFAHPKVIEAALAPPQSNTQAEVKP